MHHKMLSSISGLYPLYASSTLSSCNTQKCFQILSNVGEKTREKITLVENLKLEQSRHPCGSHPPENFIAQATRFDAHYMKN